MPTGEQNIEPPSHITAEDSSYAGVFLPLDGIWVGRFEIYEDSEGQRDLPKNSSIPLDTNYIKKQKLINSLDVRQQYVSKTPFYQQVSITDTYVNDRDTTVVMSRGVNKIEGGQLWCVVEKPSEKIVHLGKFDPPNTIIWYRNETAPLKKEFFSETVNDENYTIVGYGYYGEDDPERMPKTWFIGRYHQLSEYIR